MSKDNKKKGIKRSSPTKTTKTKAKPKNGKAPKAKASAKPYRPQLRSADGKCVRCKKAKTLSAKSPYCKPCRHQARLETFSKANKARYAKKVAARVATEKKAA